MSRGITLCVSVCVGMCVCVCVCVSHLDLSRLTSFRLASSRLSESAREREYVQWAVVMFLYRFSNAGKDADHP
jgi:chemotaxis receptor (MCP) glutamine deamidase CheD